MSTPNSNSNQLDCQGHHPTTFKQPLLHVLFKTGSADGMFIDVSGRIGDFLQFDPKDKQNHLKKGGLTWDQDVINKAATPYFRELAKVLAARGMPVVGIQIYKGSGGPSHLLRQGVLFARMSELEKPVPVGEKKEVAWYEQQPPAEKK